MSRLASCCVFTRRLEEQIAEESARVPVRRAPTLAALIATGTTRARAAGGGRIAGIQGTRVLPQRPSWRGPKISVRASDKLSCPELMGFQAALGDDPGLGSWRLS